VSKFARFEMGDYRPRAAPKVAGERRRALLRELREHRPASGSYAEIETALVGIMRAHQGMLPNRLSARDVLVYARDNGLIARHGDTLHLSEPLAK
jgi:hypothetical protein